MVQYAIITLVGISSALAGFSVSQLLSTVKLAGRVSVAEVEIENIKDEKSETNTLLTAIVDQNTKLLAHMGVTE